MQLVNLFNLDNKYRKTLYIIVFMNFVAIDIISVEFTAQYRERLAGLELPFFSEF